MSKDKALKFIENSLDYCANYDSAGGSELYYSTTVIQEAIEIASEPEWVDVKVQLPKESGYVGEWLYPNWVTAFVREQQTMESVEPMYMLNGEWFNVKHKPLSYRTLHLDGKDYKAEVICWQPLSEAPKKEQP